MTQEEKPAKACDADGLASGVTRDLLVFCAIVLVIGLLLCVVLGAADTPAGDDDAADDVLVAQLEGDEGSGGDGGATSEVGADAGSVSVYDTSAGVAATVGDVQIGEAVVTDAIESFREQSGLQEEGDWGIWLAENGYSAESLRAEVLGGYVSAELSRQAEETYGVTAPDDQASTAFDLSSEQLEYLQFIDDFKTEVGVETTAMPKGLPYDIDVTPYLEEANE